MTNKYLTLTLLAFVTSFNAFASNGSIEKINDYLDLLVENDKAMLSASIVHKGKVVYQYPNSKETTSSKHLYRVGSISKIYTASLIMKLVEEGKLTLDTPLSQFYPDIKNAQKITIKDLLNHRSGLFNFTSLGNFASIESTQMNKNTFIEMVQGFKPDFRPGTRHAYSNTNYVLLGYILEDVSNKSYAQLLREWITTPLSLKDTFFMRSGGENHTEMPSFKIDRSTGQWKEAARTHMSVPHGAGAIVSTANDVNQFLGALSSAKVVSAKSLSMMKQLQDGYGLGLMRFPFYQHHFWGHNGAIDGFVATAGYNPEQDLSFTLIANGINYGFNDITIGILSIYMDKPFELPDFSATPTKIETAELQTLTGQYVSTDLSLEINIFLDSGQLMGQTTGQGAFPLTAYSDKEFRFEQAGIVIQFSAQSDNTPQSFTLNQSGGKFRYTRKNH